MSELRIDHLIKSYGDMRAVDDVSLHVDDGEFLVLLGPSGCGKSTLLRSIAGLEEIDEGTISIGGVDVTSRKPKDRNISMVFQNYAVFPHLTVAKNIAFGLERQRKSSEEIDRRVRSAAELLHIEELLDRRPNSLSGGQRQRVAVARAIAYDSDLLLMDEPLSNLDALLRLEMRAELKRLVAEIGATVIYVTHDQTEALSMGDRVAVMHDGRIVQLDRPIEIYDNPATRFVAAFIGNPPMNLLSATVLDDRSGVAMGAAGRIKAIPPDAGSGVEVTVGVRAESIAVGHEAGEWTIPAEVVVVEPLGSHNAVTVQADEQLVRVTTDPDEPIAVGDKVHLRVPAEKVRWLS
ncbi:MAG: ABC transporter ATP-binding protein [Actinomycetota bacterium]